MPFTVRVKSYYTERLLPSFFVHEVLSRVWFDETEMTRLEQVRWLRLAPSWSVVDSTRLARPATVPLQPTPPSYRSPCSLSLPAVVHADERRSQPGVEIRIDWL